tara:strand:- start:54 stop:545 length:492 start_codon:yes stop_codon:yes gene_type:complete
MEKEKKYSNGFKTPPNYFESVEDAVFQKILEEELPKTTGFEVPEEYFSTFEKELFEKIRKEPKKVNVKQLYRQNWFQYSIGIAACLVIGLVFFWDSTSVESPEATEIATYIQNDGLDLDSYDIAQLLSEEQIDELIDENNLFSEESMENYILEHLDDPSLLTE